MALEKGLQSADYVTFSLGIFASLAAGMIYAYRERKHKSSYHFHRGGGKLKAFPVAMSMLVTFESSIFFLGFPAEVYVHGFIFWLVNIGMALGFSAMFWISIPLFYPLQVTSVYEYLQMRHDSLLIRQIAMVLGAIFMTLYSGIVLFGAAIALQSVTGVSVWIFIVAMSGIAVIYTSLGGIKAVIVTDVVQGIIMIGVIFAVLIYGTMCVGGVQNVIDLNKPSGRMKMIDFDPNPFTRHTFWTLVVGSFFRSIGYSCRQPVIQRLNSTKSMNEARKVAAISIPGFVILQLLVMFEGLVAYAYYVQKGCDPLASGQISNPNQIISFVVMDMFETIPGITGLFLAALCSASLSTISSLLSSVSAIVAEDVIRQKWKTISEINLTKASKLMVLLCGFVCIGVGLIISNVKGPMTQISSSILGAIDGPVTALFIMSIFIKFTTIRGILASMSVGIAFALWLSLGYNFSPGRKRTPWLPLGPTDKCYNETDANMDFFNYSTTLSNITDMMTTEKITATKETGTVQGIDHLYSISYLYISLMVTIVSLTVGLLISKLTKLERKTPVPSYLMLGINKRFFRCQPNYDGELELESMPEKAVTSAKPQGHHTTQEEENKNLTIDNDETDVSK
jgi:SSS family transporter